MKKIIIMILLLTLLSSCVLKPNIYNSKESKDPISVKASSNNNEEHVTYGETPSYEKIQSDIDSYFRMFYANNYNYKWKLVDVEQRSSEGTDVTGYFDGDSLVKMVSCEYISRASYITTYYFVNKNLTYVVFYMYGSMLHEDSYRDYFIIDGSLWQYDKKTSALVESSDTSVIKYFEQDKHELLGNQETSIIRNKYSLPTQSNLFTQFNKMKNIYFRKLFAGVTYNKEYFHADLPNYISDPYNCEVLFKGLELLKLFVKCSEKTSYTKYEYYLIDDTHIYVVTYYTEFKNYEMDFNDYKKNYYDEYFIVNNKVMKYDPLIKDLVYSHDNSEILSYFDIAKKSSIHNTTGSESS